MAVKEQDAGQGSESPIANKPSLKELYTARKGVGVKAPSPKAQVAAPQATATGVPQAGSGLPKVKAPSKAKDFTLIGGAGYPQGLPPGAARMTPAWDYDQASGKFLVGKSKEKARQGLWERYRKIQSKRGQRASGVGASVAKKPTVTGLKYG